MSQGMSGAGIERESRAARWARRLVTVPVTLCVVVIELALLPWMLIISVVADVVSARDWRLSRFVLATTWSLWVHVAGLAMLFYSWLLGLRWLGADPERQQRLDFAVQVWWATWTWRGAARIYRMRLRCEGREALEGAPFLLWARHSSLIDTIMPLVALSARNGLRLRYVMKRELLWDPCVDVFGHRYPTAFVKRGTQRHGPELAKVRALLDDLTDEDVVVLYPEGTRFSEEKRERILASLRRKQPAVAEWAETLRHVLPPHPGGALTLLSKGDLDVVFCAHTGLEGAGHISEMIHGSLLDAYIRVQFWRAPASSIPEGDEARMEWLREWWTRIDDWVDHHLIEYADRRSIH